MSVSIRPELPRDTDTIHAVTTAAFEAMPFSDGTEPVIVDRLRADGDLTLSLVAESLDGQIVGHIAFSPVTAGNGTDDWYGLGPVSVEPGHQGQGVGRALIEAGLQELRRRNAAGCVLVGDPRLYERFGFCGGGLTYGDLDPALVQHILMDAAEHPSGEVRYAAAFESAH